MPGEVSQLSILNSELSMPITTHRPLPAELKAIQDEMEEIAAGYGLDFFETIFEVLDYEELSMFAAYGGFPVRYPHWRFGAEYDELMKSYSYGLSKIYEMVINTDPCYAYLLSANAITDQKLVIAHVYGHCDFFKNNAWFSKTNRKMLDQMANHAAKVNRYIDRYGYEKVEQFIDACLSLDDLIDPYSPHIRRTPDPKKVEEEAKRRKQDQESDEQRLPEGKGKFVTKEYMDSFVNPPDVLKAEEEARRQQMELQEASRSFPAEPQRDVLRFLLQHAPLKEWQHDILAIIRDEAYYFAPQGQTKIMNEGWACVAGDTLVATDHGLRSMQDVVADTEAGNSWSVFDGDRLRPVSDCHVIRGHKTISIETKLGLQLTGSTNHRVLLDDCETWKRLDELAEGDVLAISGPPKQHAKSDVSPALSPLQASLFGWMSMQLCRKCVAKDGVEGVFIRQTTTWGEAEAWMTAIECMPRQGSTIGYLNSDTDKPEFHVGKPIDQAPQKTGMRARARHNGLFLVWDEIPAKYRSLIPYSSETTQSLSDAVSTLHGSAVGELVKGILKAAEDHLTVGTNANRKKYHELHRKFGINNVTVKDAGICRVLQLLLLSEGIVTRRRESSRDSELRFDAAATAAFDVKFGVSDLTTCDEVREFLAEHADETSQCRWANEVTSTERGQGDVYDITVETSHRYAAAGLINHNSYWHSKIMTKHGLTDAEVIDYADHHSGTMAMSPQRLNPYKVGIELLKDIEDRWNKGKFGPEWDDCDDINERKNWDRQLGLGREKIFEIRRIHNDVTFIDTFLTEEFCRKHKFFSFAYNEHSGDYEIASRQFEAVKQQLLTSLTNHGRPFIYVQDGNYKNRGELYLRHEYQGVELKQDYARDTLVNLQKLWSRPVHIETVIDEEQAVISFDGTTHEVRIT